MGEPDAKPPQKLDLGDAAGLNDFLAAFLNDCEAGCVRSVAEYQAQFPRHRDSIAAEFAVLDAGPVEQVLPDIPEVVIEHVIGRGGQGIVYRGRQAYLDRPVAVKVLLPTLLDPHFASRFRREARTLAGLTHPHIVTCYHAGVTESGTCYLVMEFVPGPTLRRWLDQHGRLPMAAAATLARDLASALAHAQSIGIVHRDVKPENVLLQPLPDAAAGAFAYRPKLVDLGLARPLQLDRRQSMATPAGLVIGTPATMAPEQFDAPDQVDQRADIYGLGCVLYHALTGKAAFDDRRMTVLMVQKDETLGPDPRALVPELPASIAGLVRRMLAKSPADRPATHDQLLAELEALLAPAADVRLAARSVRRRWPGTAALAVLMVGAGTGGYWWSTVGAARGEPKPGPAVANEVAADALLPLVALFAEGDDPFATWTCDGEAGRDEDTGAPNLNRRQGAATAQRGMAFATFLLQGKLEPHGRFENGRDVPVARTGVRLEFADGSAVQLDLQRHGDGYLATLRRQQRRDSTGPWQDGDTIETAAGTWSKQRPLPFVLRLGTDGLAYRLGGMDGDAPLQSARGPGQLGTETAPAVLVLFVEAGRTCFVDFELRGR